MMYVKFPRRKFLQLAAGAAALPVVARAARAQAYPLRPVRIMMRAQWEKGLKGLDSPVASPYAVSFYTLPRHWEFMDEVNAATPTANMLPDGDFETVPGRAQEQWYKQESTLDDVDMQATRVSEIAVKPPKVDPKKKAPAQPQTLLTAKEGRQFLLLEIKPKVDPKTGKPVQVSGLERTFLAINSPGVRLPPGSLVRVSGWVALPDPIQLSADGALLFDSAGGEPLAIRATPPLPWVQFTLYRRVPTSGTISVTLALTGIGQAYFDDIRIEPLVRK